MIKLSNGHELEHVVASGALAFDGKGWDWEKPLIERGIIQPELFTVVIKSLTRRPREGNLNMKKPWQCVRPIWGGVVNKVGLTNDGVEHWRDKIAPTIDFKKVPLIGSVYAESRSDLIETIEILSEFPFVAIEINDSCPNTGHKLDGAQTVIDNTTIARAHSSLPFISKLSVSQDYVRIAQGLKGVVEAISINSVPWGIAFPDGRRSPLWRLEQRVGGGGGGVSGKPAQKHNWEAVRKLAEDGSLPVIAPSVMKYSDLKKVRALGARAISYGTIILLTPWRPTRIVLKDMEEKKKGKQ